MNASNQDLVTLGEAAELLGVSRFKIGRLIRDGLLVAFRSPLDARAKLVRRADLEALREPVEIDPAETGKAAALAA